MKDFCFHPGFLAQWKERIPHIQTLTSDDAGHYLLEDAFDFFISKIQAFLS